MAINIDAILNINKVNLPTNIGEQLSKVADSTLGRNLALGLNPALKQISNVVKQLTALKSTGDDVTQEFNALKAGIRLTFDASEKQVLRTVKVLGLFENAVKDISKAEDQVSFDKLVGKAERLKGILANVVGGPLEGRAQLRKQLDDIVGKATLDNAEKIQKSSVRTKEQLISDYKSVRSARLNAIKDEINALNNLAKVQEQLGNKTGLSSTQKKISEAQKRQTQFIKASEEEDISQLSSKQISRKRQGAFTGIEKSVARKTDISAQIQQEKVDGKERADNLRQQEKRIQGIQKEFTVNAIKEQKTREDNAKKEVAARNAAVKILDGVVREELSIYDRETDALRRRQEILRGLGKEDKARRLESRIGLREQRKQQLASLRATTVDKGDSQSIGAAAAAITRRSDSSDAIKAQADLELDIYKDLQAKKLAEAKATNALIINQLREQVKLSRFLASDNAPQALKPFKAAYENRAQLTDIEIANKSNRVLSPDNLEIYERELAAVRLMTKALEDQQAVAKELKKTFFEREASLRDQITEYSRAAINDAKAAERELAEGATARAKEAKEIASSKIREIRQERAEIRELEEERQRLINARAKLTVSQSTRGAGAAGTEQLPLIEGKLRQLDAQIAAKTAFADIRTASLSSADQAKIKPVTVSDLSTKNIIDATKEATKLNNQFNNAHINATKFGQAVGLAAKRFSAFIIGSSPIFLIIQGFRLATTEALKFEKQITRIQQVLNTRNDTSGIFEQIKKSAAETGTNINDLAQGIQVFAQAGITDIEQLTNTVKDLAKVPLAPTFDTVEATVEGLLATFGQFNKGLGDTGQILNLVNQFAADFGVESQDLFEAGKRGGAAFSAAGGSLEEFVSLLSVLRESTRESAETLGTFFKTGTAQLLSSKSQSQLRLLGVESTNLTGQLEELAKILFGQDVNEKDSILRIQRVERLTGERQFSRLISLLRELANPETTDRIQKSFDNVFNSVDRSTAQRLDDVGVSLERIKQAMIGFASSIIENEALKSFIQSIANLTTALLQLASTLAPLLPLFATFAAFKLASSVGNINAGIKKTLGFGLDLGIGASAKSAKNVLSSTNVSDLGKIIKGGVVDGFKFATGNRVGGGLSFDFKGKTSSFTGPSLPIDIERARRTERRDALRRQRSGGRLVGIGAIGLGAAALGATGIGTGIGGGAVGTAATTGIITGSILSIFSPLVGIIGGVIAAFSSLITSIEQVRKKRVEEGISAAQRLNPNKNSIAESFNVIENNKPGALARIKGGAVGVLEAAATLISDNFTEVSDKEYKAIQREVLQATGKQKSSKDVGVFATDVDQVIQASLNTTVNREVKALGEAIQKDTAAFAGKNLRNIAFTNVVKSMVAQLNAIGVDINVGDIRTRLQELLAEGVISFGNLVQKIPEDLASVLDFQDIGLELKRSFIRSVNGLTKTFDEIGRTSDALGSIVTNINDLVTISIPTVDADLFSGAGLDQIINLQKNVIDEFAGRLSQIIQTPGFFGSLTSLQEEISSGSEEGGKKTIASLSGTELFESRFASVILQIKDAGLVFEQLAALAGTSVPELLTQLSNTDGNLNKFVSDLLGADTTLAEVRKNVEGYINNLNKQLELQKSLADVLRTLDNNLFEVRNNINDTFNNLQDRTQEQLAFSTRLNSLESNAQKAISLTNRALTSQFSNLSGFITDLTTATQTRGNAVADAATAKRDNNFTSPAFQASLEAQIKLTDLQRQAAQRLNDFERRIGAAATASDILKATFLEFKGAIQAAGSAVTGFTIKDLGESFAAFDKFATLSNTFSDIGTGLEGLSDIEFGGLQKILQAATSFDLGSGITGGDLLGDINETLGLPLLAAIRGRVTGESQDVASKAIQQELADLKTQQEQAANIETALRQQQLALLEAQAQLIPVEQQFYKDQLTSLEKIDVSIISKIDEIKDLMGSLFEKHLPIIGKLSSSSTNATGALQVNQPNVEIESGTGPSSRIGYLDNVVTTWLENVAVINDALADVPAPLRYFTSTLELIAAGIGSIGSIFGFATGGRVGGSGSRDTVPAMLTPGEYVINKKAASKLGPQALEQLNSGKMPRFATGGAVGNNDQYRKDLQQAIEARKQYIIEFRKFTKDSENPFASSVENTTGSSALGGITKGFTEFFATVPKLVAIGINDAAGPIGDSLRKRESDLGTNFTNESAFGVTAGTKEILKGFTTRESAGNQSFIEEFGSKTNETNLDFALKGVNLEIAALEKALNNLTDTTTKTSKAVESSPAAKKPLTATEFKNAPLSDFKSVAQKAADAWGLEFAKATQKLPTQIIASSPILNTQGGIGADGLRDALGIKSSTSNDFIGGGDGGQDIPLNERDLRRRQEAEKTRKSQEAFRKVFPDAQFGRREEDSFIGRGSPENTDPFGIKAKRRQQDSQELFPDAPKFNRRDPRFIGQNPDFPGIPPTPDISEPLNKNVSALDALNKTLSDHAIIMRKMVERENTPVEGPRSVVEIAPIQVNVALNAPDVSKLLGNSVYNAVMAQLAPALGEAFGVVSDEAKSVFESRI